MKLTHFSLLAALLIASIADAQTESRLIATSIRDYENGTSFELTDTSAFKFSNDRGGDLAHTMKYDSSRSWKYISTVLTNDKKVYQTFDINDNILTSLQQLWNTGTSIWEDKIMNLYTYDVNDQVISHKDMTWNTGTAIWDSTSKTAYVYDIDGHLLSLTKQLWNTGTNTWENDIQDTYSYDVDGNEAAYTHTTWDGTTWLNGSRRTYTYTNNDLILHLEEQWSTVNNAWENVVQYLFTYDTNHRMLTRTVQSWISGAWKNDLFRTNTYTGDDLTLTEEQNWNSGNSSWENSSRNYLTYDTGHNMIEDISQVWNGFSNYDNLTRFQKEYNSYHQLTHQLSENWDGTQWTPFLFDRIYRFYYEEYTPIAASSDDGLPGKSGITLYPIPAVDILNVKMAGNSEQTLTISVLDMQGRLARNYGKKTSVSFSIPTSDLSPGNYMIKISQDNQTYYSQFMITR